MKSFIIQSKNKRWLVLMALYFFTLSIGMLRYTNVFQTVEMTDLDETQNHAVTSSQSIN